MSEPLQTISVESLLAAYRDLSRKIAPDLAELDKLKSGIKDAVLAQDRNFAIDGATATISKGYTRVSYDSSKLDGYAVAHPEIRAFRKASKVKATVVVKVEG